jgi:hypothetical protein
MTTEKIKRMVAAYDEELSVPYFLSSLFRSPAENFVGSAELIEWDVMRHEEDVAVPQKDPSTGYRYNQFSGYTNKQVDAPTYKEAFAIAASTLNAGKSFGRDAYDDPSFQEKAAAKTLIGMRKLEQKIRRGMELQASQILTTGVLNLTDTAGNTAFAVDFAPKAATHFTNAGTAWSTATDPVVDDILPLCDAIRNDGKRDPIRMHMGEGSWEAALAITKFTDRLKDQFLNLGSSTPMPNPGTNGGNLRGWLEVGSYRLEIYTYGGRYKHPQTGTVTKYIPDDKVIIESGGRLDAYFGAIPNFGQDGRALRYMPSSRFASPGRGMDMTVNAWLDNPGEVLNVGVGARVLLVPTAIDTFGCLDTGI